MPSKSNATLSSKIAGIAITNRYCVILDPDNNERVLLPTADNMDCLGFADDGQDTVGLHIAIHTGEGERYAVASGSITKGARLICASGGKVKAMPSSSGTYFQIARALEAGTDGNILRVIVEKRVYYIA